MEKTKANFKQKSFSTNGYTYTDGKREIMLEKGEDILFITMIIKHLCFTKKKPLKSAKFSRLENY